MARQGPARLGKAWQGNANNLNFKKMKHILLSRWGYNSKGVDPEKIYRELSIIHDKNNGILPNQVVQVAKSPKSELHKCFDWDNTKASDKWRLHQARQVIKAIRIIKEDVSESPRICYIKIDDKYKSVSTVIMNESEYIQALHYLQSKVEQSEKALRDLMRYAKKDDSEKMTMINLAMEAFSTARKAIEAL